MGLCYICNGKLFGKQNKVCSGVLPYSNSSYKDKIADILGDEFFVIVTPVDHLCEDCTTLLIRVDKDESDLKLIKDSFVSSILKKHGFLPASIHDKTSNVINENINLNELEVQKRVIRKFKMENNLVVSPKKFKTKADGNFKDMVYKCSFCKFYSKEIEHFSFHMRTHENKEGNYKQTDYTVTNTLPVGKKYRCCSCIATFNSKTDCSDHIQKNHKPQTIQTAIEKEVILSDTAKDLKNELLILSNAANIQKNIAVTAVNTNMLLNVSANNKQETLQINKVLPAQGQEKTMEIYQNDILQDIDVYDDDITNLDIESMLATFFS